MTDIKKVLIVSIISCIFSISGIAYKVMKPEPAPQTQYVSLEYKDWDVMLVKKTAGSSLQDLRGFIHKMGLSEEEDIIFGFMAKKDPNKKWDNAILGDELKE